MRKTRNPWEEAIAEHGRRAAPQEACGVIATGEAGHLEAFPLRNVHPSPERCFLLDPQEYLKLYAAGRVRAYYHSHPTGTAEFSEADRVLSEESRLPCYLYAVELDELAAYTPNGWRPPIEGRLFMPGVNDCLSLVRDWLESEMAITLELPPRSADILNSGLPDMGHWIERNTFVRVAGQPQRGDLILMHIRASGSRPNHIAVYVGDGLILHQLVTEPSGLAPWGGMWEHCTAMILRHHSLLPAPPPSPAGTNLEPLGTKLSPP